jgi:hypothetical protein
MQPKKPNREAVNAAIYEVLDNQLRENDPPETNQTLQKLLAAGYSLAEARRLLAIVILTEIDEMMRLKRSFDLASFVAALHRLPRLPWE